MPTNVTFTRDALSQGAAYIKEYGQRLETVAQTMSPQKELRVGKTADLPTIIDQLGRLVQALEHVARMGSFERQVGPSAQMKRANRGKTAVRTKGSLNIRKKK